jgi:hypothetical protein
MGINQSGIRAKTAAEEVNRLRNWKRTRERFEENKWKFRRKVTPLRSYESDPLFRWKVTP